MDKSKQDIDPEFNEFVEKYIWMVRPCVDYENEMKECQSAKGRFHQYFLYGELLDCSKWSQDAINCSLCLKNKNNESCTAIIKNETTRRLNRISAAKQNDVWKKRDKPPDNWNQPLPDNFAQRFKQSLLTQKIDEYNEYISHNEPDKAYSCTIL